METHQKTWRNDTFSNCHPLAQQMSDGPSSEEV